MTSKARRPERVSARLPVFPWDTIADAAATARAHPGGIVDLSVGTPVDPVAPLIREALATAGSASGYPTTAGTEELRDAVVARAGAPLRNHRVDRGRGPAGHRYQGTHRVAAHPARAGCGRCGGHPELAYPTYEVGRAWRAPGVARRLADAVGPAVAGTRVHQFAGQSDRQGSRRRASSQGGRLGAATRLGGRVRRVLSGSRLDGRADLGPASKVCGADHTGLLAVHSLSKSSSLAGYRAGFVAGDPALVAELLAVRKHAGMMVPTPVQAAMVAALNDDAHENEQRARYARRRESPAGGGAQRGIHRRPFGRGSVSVGDPRSTVPGDRRMVCETRDSCRPGEFYGPRVRASCELL